MSLSLALGNALSGLGATARMAEVVSANLANALTEGYGRRSVDLAAQSLGGRGAGVAVVGIARQADPALLAERRSADSLLQERRTLADALRGLEGELGADGAGTSLAQSLRALESALVAAGADPSSDTRLGQVLDRLGGVTQALAANAGAVQARRAAADAGIARGVADLGAALDAVARLDADIATALAQGRDATALADQRQVQIDAVARLVPIRVMERAQGGVALVTPRGAMLLDGTRAARVGFVATPVVTADQTLAAGGLSGLTLDGAPVGADGVGRLAGGALGALFQLRDADLPAVSDRLDALARDLLERLGDPATDPTLAGGPGLLTDAGAAFDPLAPPGLAARLAVHAAVDPAQGGELRRLRDGVGAATPGPAGEAGQIRRVLAALDAPRALATGGQPASAATLAATLSADLGARRLGAERDETFASARWSTLREDELGQGVDSDRELQILMSVEKAYAANAKVLAAVDGMLSALLEI